MKEKPKNKKKYINKSYHLTNEITNDKEIYDFLKQKINYFQDIIQKTVLSCYQYKMYDILNQNDLMTCLEQLQILFKDLRDIYNEINSKTHNNLDMFISKLQDINNDLSNIIKNYGTQDIRDLISICFGSKFKPALSKSQQEKFNIILKYVKPINFKAIANTTVNKNNKKNICKNKITEDITIAENTDLFDCFDINDNNVNFYVKVYGIKVSIFNQDLNKCLIIYGIMDDIIPDFYQCVYIDQKLLELNAMNVIKENETSITQFIKTLSLKDLIIYNNNELYEKYIDINKQIKTHKQKIISIVVKDFLKMDLYRQREILIQLLLKENDTEYQYLAYLLYDLLSNEINGVIDTQEQTVLYDSLPLLIKQKFKVAMKKTIECTNKLNTFETSNKIPLEQQICLLKTSDAVKEKALIKLKEVKAKSDESGTKARQYLDGLLKIPFGIYKKEEILYSLGDIKTLFNKIILIIKNKEKICEFIDFDMNKSFYTSIDIIHNINQLQNSTIEKSYSKILECIIVKLCTGKREKIIANITYLNKNIAKNNIDYKKLLHSGKKIEMLKSQIKQLFFNDRFNYTDIINNPNSNNSKFIYTIINKYYPDYTVDKKLWCFQINEYIDIIKQKRSNMQEKISEVRNILDTSVHGHNDAKRQIERIIGQWINGDEQTGYCFGFEGPPGVGKTSLAKKGLASCLKDNDGNTRPFVFIAVGGSAITLDGHNYTYVGSTWGRIVDALMDAQCLNPIIFIDELDKISNTEHGRDIIGVLTHMTDGTQNEKWQDKYFSGIDLDLSKALFIFSYNNVEQIDRVLLDRIHRIKFKHLSITDKLTITQDYLLPEIYNNMGLNNNIVMDDKIIKHLVETYTCESGVRKLKEILFEIVGEINLELIQSNYNNIQLPYTVTIDEVTDKYLKSRRKAQITKIHNSNMSGIINGLWANSIGQGGIITIETKFFPSKTMFELKLTGKQGDVMKESMNVALSVALNLLTKKERNSIYKKLEETKYQGIHIHCPEGGVPKDGPSAGTAITIALYSLLSNKKINRKFAITGEMNLRGDVTAIGGLDLKIIGGIAAGVTNFIYPLENKQDFDLFMEKYQNDEIIEGINFYSVENINQVKKLILTK